MMRSRLWLLLPLVLSGCTHVSGVVEQSPGRPLPSAVLSVGRPDGIAIYAKHRVDSQGRFDFRLAPMDESHLYVYDGAGDPRMTMRRIEAIEMRKGMRILLRPAAPNTDLTP